MTAAIRLHILLALSGAASLLGAAGAFHLPRSGFVANGGVGRGRGVVNHFPCVARAQRVVAVRPRNDRGDGGSSRLRCALLPSHASSTVFAKLSSSSPAVRASLLIGAVAVAIYGNRGRFNFFPGTDPDPSFSEPLPDGSFGCPLFGNVSFLTKMGDAKSGMGKFYRWQAERAGNSNIFKYMAFGTPLVMVSGMRNVKKVFNREFRTVETGAISQRALEVIGGESMLFVNDADRHQFMRRLVGQSLTPEAVEAAVPALIASANEQIDTLSPGGDPAVMEDVLTRFTLDVAWRQILGLDLREGEIETFNAAVNDWILGILNPLVTILPVTKYTRCGKALKYLKSKIYRKLDSLERDGPDGSTLSGMYFAKDDEDPTRSLSRDEIISNSLLLILAGSETAASTLTVAMLALGLHKDVFRELREEQLAMMSKRGGGEPENMTREALEEDCPYLDAVIKETMRIKPLASTGAMRFAKETIVVDGKQIPKGWGVGFNPTLTHTLDPDVREEDGSHMDVARGFRPERWTSGGEDDTSSLARPTEYMPWGVGPRYCLGYHLAVAEMKVFLALFARRVDFDLTNTTKDNVRWKRASIIPKPKDGAVISVSSLSDGAYMGSAKVESVPVA